MVSLEGADFISNFLCHLLLCSKVVGVQQILLWARNKKVDFLGISRHRNVTISYGNDHEKMIGVKAELK